MLILLQIIKAWQNQGLPIDALEASISSLESVDHARLYLGTLLESEASASQAERLYRVINNGSYRSAFRLADLEGSDV